MSNDFTGFWRVLELQQMYRCKGFILEMFPQKTLTLVPDVLENIVHSSCKSQSNHAVLYTAIREPTQI